MVFLLHCVSSPQSCCFVLCQKFLLPVGMHSSCSISSTADGTCQKCFTKHRDGWDKTQCSWRFVDADCIGLFYLSVNIVLLFSGKELPVSADEARTLLAPDAAVSIFSDAAESPPPLLSNDEADRVKRRQE